jgi:hypothetical protein
MMNTDHDMGKIGEVMLWLFQSSHLKGLKRMMKDISKLAKPQPRFFSGVTTLSNLLSK